MEKEKRCPVCGAQEKQRKYGTNGSGSARTRCGLCGKTYVAEPKVYDEDTKELAIRMYYEGVSGRGVGRLLGMSKANVFRWIKERAANLPEPDPHTAENSEPVEVIELDEMYHFLEKKK